MKKQVADFIYGTSRWLMLIMWALLVANLVTAFGEAIDPRIIQDTEHHEND